MSAVEERWRRECHCRTKIRENEAMLHAGTVNEGGAGWFRAVAIGTALACCSRHDRGAVGFGSAGRYHTE